MGFVSERLMNLLKPQAAIKVKMKFSDIPGHQHVKESLTRLADSDCIPHAIMLCGPSGIGKMAVARAFSNYVHCRNRRDGEPCGECPDCLQHKNFNHPDVHFSYPIVKSEKLKRYVSADEIDHWKEMLRKYPSMPLERWLEIIEAGNAQPVIHVNEAEYIIRHESFAPFSSKYKFFIIWLPERLRPEAANGLLKVIEEPTEGTVFILVSDEEDKVLPTISSRTQRFNMGTLTPEEIAGYLRNRYGVSEYEAPDLARICGGLISRADELGQHSGENREFESLFREIMRASYGKKLALLRTLGDKAASFGREKLIRFMRYMGRMVRENFIYNMRMPMLQTMTRDEDEFAKRFSPFINHCNVEAIMHQIERAETDIARNANAKVVLFDFFLLLIPQLHKKAT